MSQKRAFIAGIREYFPKQVVTNYDLEKIVDTNHEWIVERTGVFERRKSEPHETPSLMGTESAKKLLQDLNVSPESLDLILVATVTPDYIFPATACIIQEKLGAKNAWGFDLSAACSGYLFALETARAYIESERAKRVLLIAAEKMSSILDYTDRTTCVLFGDGGSATLLEGTTEKRGILDSLLKVDGSGASCLYMPAGGSRFPATLETVQKKEHVIKQEGRAVFKRAVVDMANICVELLNRHGLQGKDIKLFVPHQANIRILEAAAERMNLPKEKVAINIDKYGNTTAATIPTALYQAQQAGKVKEGDLILLASFGAGYTWGATLLRL